MFKLCAATFAFAASLALSPASATIFTTADFAPIQLGSGGSNSTLSAFDFYIDIPDEEFVDGTYNYNFSADALTALFTHTPLATNVPDFELTFGGDPQYGTSTVTSESLNALNGSYLSLGDVFLNALIISLELGDSGAVQDAQIAAVLDASTGFTITGSGDQVTVFVGSTDPNSGCFGFGCAGTATPVVQANVATAPGGLALIALAGLILIRRRKPT